MLVTNKETNKKLSGRFISFIKHAYSLVQSTRLSPYSCKYSRKDYTQHQLLTRILFKEYRNEDYRTVIWNLGEMDRIRAVLGLTTIPHFTTLQKFLFRIKPLNFNLLSKKYAETVLFGRRCNLHNRHRFIRIYQRVLQSLLLRTNRKNPKTFPENIDFY